MVRIPSVYRPFQYAFISSRRPRYFSSYLHTRSPVLHCPLFTPPCSFIAITYSSFEPAVTIATSYDARPDAHGAHFMPVATANALITILLRHCPLRSSSSVFFELLLSSMFTTPSETMFMPGGLLIVCYDGLLT